MACICGETCTDSLCGAYPPKPVPNANGYLVAISGIGAPGPAGPPGPAGADSTVPGPAGPAGERGEPGPVGATGNTGATGAAGATGPAGPAGAQGIPGPVGATGPAGATGATGATGARGPVGPAGAKGDPGPAGAPGGTGPQGEPGVPGATGSTGAQGIPGPVGATGAPGPVGPQGPAGLGIKFCGSVATVDELPATATQGDLYNVETPTPSHGWVWDDTEQAWIDAGQIQGPEGPVGATGATGPAGVQGEPGVPGVDGVDGAAGATGAQGEPGIQGPVGPAGPTAVSADSGNSSVIGSDGLIFTPAAAAATGFLPLAGGTMTGTIVSPTNVNFASFGTSGYGVLGGSGGVAMRAGTTNLTTFTNANVTYGVPIVTQNSATAVRFGSAGPTLGAAGGVIQSSTLVSSAPAPTAPEHLANKQYVDGQIASGALVGPAGPQGEQGIPGVQGPAGLGIQFKGEVPTYADLPSTGQVQGDLWTVASPTPAHGWAWDAATSSWVDAGQIQGPQGVPGVQGVAGATGETGAVGPAGPVGPIGPEGPQGPAGEGASYTLPVATATVLGGVKIGSGITVTADGTISSSGGGTGFLPTTGGEMTGAIVLPSGITAMSVKGTGYNMLGGSGGVAFRSNTSNIINHTAAEIAAYVPITTAGTGVGVRFGSGGPSLSKAGTTIAASSAITVAAAPAADTELANKKYVDDKVAAGGGGSSVTNPVSGSVAGMVLWTGTQAAYDAIATKSNTTVYHITG